MKKYKFITKELLIKEYIKNKKSIRQTAKILNVSTMPIANRLTEYNIPRRTISKALQGKHCSLKTEFKKGHKLNIGKNNGCYIDGRNFESYPLGWTDTYKEQIRCRDGYKCQICNKTQQQELDEINQKLSIHHIDYNKENINPNNLISICHKCHMKTNYNRDYWFAYFTYIMKNIIISIGK